MNEFLAIDIGASSGRHILGSVQNGKMVLEEIYRFPNGPKKKDGCLVWDAERLFEEVLNGLKKAKELGRIPKYVGIDTWAVDYALLDGECNLIGDVVSYRDLRTEAAVPKVHAKIPFEALYEKTGIQFQPFNTIYQLYCDLESGKLANAKHMLMLPDYLNYRLTGKMSREFTNSTSTGLINAQTRTWDKEILEKLSFPPDLFPETTPTGSKLGTFSPQIVEFVGYDAQVVLPATHDTASAVVAAPMGGMYISSGTWSLLGMQSPKAVTSKRARLCNFTNEGHIGGVRVQKNIMGLWLIQQIRHELGDAYSFAELAEMARANSNNYIIDVNDNRFLSPENMYAEVNAAVGKELSVGQAAYCVFHSLAESYKAAAEELQEITGIESPTLNIIGGGSKNGLLNELTAKTTKKRVITGPTEATAIGNLIVQMVAAGEFSGIEEAREVVKKSFDIGEI